MTNCFVGMGQHDFAALRLGLASLEEAYREVDQVVLDVLIDDEQGIPTLVISIPGTQDFMDVRTIKTAQYQTASKAIWKDVFAVLAGTKEALGKDFRVYVIGHSLGAVLAERIGATLSDAKYRVFGVLSVKVMTLGGIGHSHTSAVQTIRIINEGDVVSLYHRKMLKDSKRYVLDSKGTLEYKSTSLLGTLWAFVKRGCSIGKVHGISAYATSVSRAMVRYGEDEANGFDLQRVADNRTRGAEDRYDL